MFANYHPLFRTEVAPRLADHLSELPFSVWEEGFELVMLLGKEEIVATPIRFRIIGVSPSLAFPFPTGMSRFPGVWHERIATLRNRSRNLGGRAFIFWMVKYSTKNLRPQLHSHQITAIEFRINCSDA